jgi:hypothetical protein
MFAMILSISLERLLNPLAKHIIWWLAEAKRGTKCGLRVWFESKRKRRTVLSGIFDKVSLIQGTLSEALKTTARPRGFSWTTCSFQ